MDLIYTDKNKKELGYLCPRCYVDFELGGNNDFKVVMPAEVWKKEFNKGSLIFEDTPNSEIGGLVTGLISDTKKKTVTLVGQTWRGLLAKEVVEPPEGQAYLTVFDNANRFIKTVLDNRFDGLLVGKNSMDISVSINHKMRYVNLKETIEKALAKQGLKMHISFDRVNMVAEITATPIMVHQNTEFSQDYGQDLIAKDINRGANHCVCLGKGELTERTVFHLYKLSTGEITQDKHRAFQDGIAGLKMKTILYENTSAETDEDLINGGTDRLKEDSDIKTLAISNVDNIPLEDVVSARDRVTGIHMQKKIKAKIIKGYVDRINIESKVGD